ncbi:hypothetical protein P7D22_22550, partial [Lichenihabitans sp. Uapishka_5]|uniref:hypothetical protein n=1 Tax=Lichenihabitans sp. Uapishka_5 TaxID=3037302 RepID=UPI0029E81599
MTRMLALVEDAVNAASAIQEGVDRLVVRVSALADLSMIGAAARGRCPVSLWWPDGSAGLDAALAACGADELWTVGPAGPSAFPVWEV